MQTTIKPGGLYQQEKERHMSKEKNYQSLPENDGIYHFGYYVVTWDTKGDYVSHVYHGTQRKGANLKKNQTLELCTGGGWENKK